MGAARAPLMPLYDSHCHLDAPSLAGDRDEVIARAIAQGVGAVLVPAIGPAGWSSLAALRDAWSGVRIALGVHPHALPALDAGELGDALASLESRARELDAAAIGECGFDGGVAIDLEGQGEVVDAHVEVARALGRPLVLHVVGAHGAALARMERHRPLPAGGVVHAWSGAAELVPRWTALGFSIGIGPVVTWARARRVKESARAVPLDRLVLETDAPDGRLESHDRGEPADVALVARAVAELRGMPERDLRQATFANAARLFG